MTRKDLLSRLREMKQTTPLNDDERGLIEECLRHLSYENTLDDELTLWDMALAIKVFCQQADCDKHDNICPFQYSDGCRLFLDSAPSSWEVFKRQTKKNKLTNCPNCNAPLQGDVCQYCGSTVEVK